jgi:hypothetical protein
MSKIARFVAPPTTLVSQHDIQRFSTVVTIHDEAGFARYLNEFLIAKRRVRAAEPEQLIDTAKIRAALKEKATALQAETPWHPSVTDLQRGRLQMLKEFNTPQNLPLARFAALANKSRQQIYKDVAAKRLLSLSIGKRGQRIPDWQLDDVRSDLTQLLLAKASAIDEWTLFHALSDPMESLGGKSPIDSVNKSNINQVLFAILAGLGVQG